MSLNNRELITPAALAVRHCRERGYHRVALIMNEEVKRDFKELQQTTGRADAVIIGDLGSAFGYDFEQVLASVGIDASAAVMIGDDIESDID